MQKMIFVLTVLLLLTSCSVFSPVKTEQPTSYVLNTLPKSYIRKSSQKTTIMVTQPVASQVYNTTQMAYSTQPYQVAYFVKSRWADTPAQMLQGLLVQSLQNTHYYYAVEVPPVLGQPDYVLNTELLQFEQRFRGSSNKIMITLRAQLIKTTTNEVVAAQQFTVSSSAPENSPYGGVVAANKAAAKLLAELTSFCVRESV